LKRFQWKIRKKSHGNFYGFWWVWPWLYPSCYCYSVGEHGPKQRSKKYRTKSWVLLRFQLEEHYYKYLRFIWHSICKPDVFRLFFILIDYHWKLQRSFQALVQKNLLVPKRAPRERKIFWELEDIKNMLILEKNQYEVKRVKWKKI